VAAGGAFTGSYDSTIDCILENEVLQLRDAGWIDLPTPTERVRMTNHTFSFERCHAH
jgi:hypothetical protein